MKTYTKATYFVTLQKSDSPCENAQDGEHADQATKLCRVFGELHVYCEDCRQKAAWGAQERHKRECPEQYKVMLVAEKPSPKRTYTQTPKKDVSQFLRAEK
jgi:hypothetical protein